MSLPKKDFTAHAVAYIHPNALARYGLPVAECILEDGKIIHFVLLARIYGPVLDEVAQACVSTGPMRRFHFDPASLAKITNIIESMQVLRPGDTVLCKYDTRTFDLLRWDIQSH